MLSEKQEELCTNALSKKCGKYHSDVWEEIWEDCVKANHLEEESHKFSPFEQVLVRDSKEDVWLPYFYGTYTATYTTIEGDPWKYCIPYTGNEALCGKVQ